MPQIEVGFDIDANGILNVSATDKATGKEQRITITANSGLSSEEVDTLVKEAEAHAEEDRLKRDLVEARNLADNSVYQAEKTLSEHDDKLPSDSKQDIRSKVSDLKDSLAGEDAARIRANLESLSNALTQVGQFVYSDSDSPPTEGDDITDSESSNDEDEVDGDETVEGEFREV